MTAPGGVVLASASPRRAALLRQAGIPFRVHPATVDESRRAGESAEDLVRRLALAKARAARRALPPDAPPADWPVLAADTAVATAGAVFGKPRHRDDFLAMMAALGGGRHRVLTAAALLWRRRERCRVVTTEVCFAPVDAAAAAAYWATGEPRDKAGGYGVQGIGGIFVRGIRGSYSAAVGLPLAETEQLLRDFGIDTWRWRTEDRCPIGSTST